MCYIIKTTTAEYPQVILEALRTQRRATVKVMGNVGRSLLSQQSRELWVTIDGEDIRVGDPTITPRVQMALGKFIPALAGLTYAAHEEDKRAWYVSPLNGEVVGRIHVKQSSTKNVCRFVSCAANCKRGIDRHREAYAMQSVYAEAGKAALQVGTVFVHRDCLPYLLRLPSCKDEHNEWPREVQMQLQQKDAEAEQDMTDIYG